MIQLLTLFCSMCVQFCSFNIQPYNNINYPIVDAVRQKLQSGNSWQQSYSLVDSSHYFVLDMANGTYKLFIPRELPEPNYPSSMTVNDSNGHYISCTLYNYVEMTYTPSTNTVGFQWPSTVSYTFYYPTESLTPTIVFCGADNFYYNNDYLIVVRAAAPVVSFDGHATGWSDLLKEGDDGAIYTELGHRFTFDDNTLETINNYWELHAGDDFSESLLAMNNRILSGISDSLSFGLGIIGKDIDDLKSWCDGFLSVFGTSIDNLVDKMLEISGVATDINDNLEGYIDYVSEPFDAAEWDLLMSTGNIGEFSAIAHSIEQMTTERTDAQHIYISWNFGNVQYFGGASGRVDMAQYLNSSKSVWQPFILTFLYAAIIWQFVKSLPNLLQGASSSVNTETRNSKNP